MKPDNKTDAPTARDEAAEPKKYLIGDRMMEMVFKPTGMTDVSNLQAVFDAVEVALAALPEPNLAGDPHELLMRLKAVQHGTDRPYAAAVCKDAGDAIKSLVEISKERDHFYNQWRACWAPLTPRSENEKQGFERVLAILKSKLSDGGGIVGSSDVQRAHNDFYRGRRVAFEECATMLRAALAPTDGSTDGK